MRHAYPLILGTLLLLNSCSVTKYKTTETASELQRLTKYLSSDLLQGRETGTAGDSLARIYIRQEMQKAGSETIY